MSSVLYRTFFFYEWGAFFVPSAFADVGEKVHRDVIYKQLLSRPGCISDPQTHYSIDSKQMNSHIYIEYITQTTWQGNSLRVR